MEAKLFVYEIDGETYVDVYNSVSELGAFFDEEGAVSGSFKVYELPFKIESTYSDEAGAESGGLKVNTLPFKIENTSKEKEKDIVEDSKALF